MWNTNDELAFIDGLGYYRNRDALVTDDDRLKLLQGYRKGLLLRTLWAGLNKDTILQHVDKKIADLTKGK